MKIVFENEFKFKDELIRGMNLAAKQLGIASEKITIILRMVPDKLMPLKGAKASVFNLPSPRGEYYIQVSDDMPAYTKVDEPTMIYYLLEGVLHELVHVKQMIKDGLKPDLNALAVSFRGKEYGRKILRLGSTVGDPEKYLPWEAEAYPKGKELAEMTMNDLGYHFEKDAP